MCKVAYMYQENALYQVYLSLVYWRETKYIVEFSYMERLKGESGERENIIL